MGGKKGDTPTTEKRTLRKLGDRLKSRDPSEGTRVGPPWGGEMGTSPGNLGGTGELHRGTLVPRVT